MGKAASWKPPLKDGSRIEKSIFARVSADGRITAFQVKIHASGSTHSICESFDSLAEAQSFRDSVRADLALDPYKEKVLRAREAGRAAKRMAGISLGDLLGDYLEQVTPTKKGAYSETYMIGKIKRFPIARQPVISLGTSAVRTFMRALLAEGTGANSVSKYLSTISACLKWGKGKLNYPIPNPVLELPASERRTTGGERSRRFLPGEEFHLQAAVGRLTNTEMLPLYTLSLETGARMSELLRLKWQDIDGAVAVARDTKNGHDRPLLLSSTAIDVLQKLRERPLRSLDGRVFRLTKGNVTARFKAAKESAKLSYREECARHGTEPAKGYLEGFRWHDLRRESISTAAEHSLSGELDLLRFSGHRDARSVRPYLKRKDDDRLASRLVGRSAPAAGKASEPVTRAG